MSGNAAQLRTITTTDVPSQERAQDYCSCSIRCAYNEYAFSGNDDYTNDKTSFLFRKIRSADTIAIELRKNGAKVADLDDNSYGTYYSTFTAQPLYVGFVIDWGLVEQALGAGTYTVFTTLTLLGSSVTTESHQYIVLPYDEEMAHDTVKIESYQTGNIEGNPFDFRGLIDGGWYQSIRVQARFSFTGVDKEEDRYLNSQRALVQNYETAVRTYSLSTRLITDKLMYRFANYELLANRLEISAYDLLAEQKYENAKMVMQSLDQSEDFEIGRVIMEAEFRDYIDDLVKRNV